MRVFRPGSKSSERDGLVAGGDVEDVEDVEGVETSEAQRALVGAALGVAMGIVVALFTKRDERDGAAEGGRGWRGKSAT